MISFVDFCFSNRNILFWQYWLTVINYSAPVTGSVIIKIQHQPFTLFSTHRDHA